MVTTRWLTICEARKNILQNNYPNEDAEYLLTISKLLTKTAVGKCTAYVPSEADGYKELVDYLRSKNKY
jgi:hypothetical protein